MANKDIIRNSLKKYMRTKQPLPGLLGTIGGQVYVTNKPHYCYVRIAGSTNSVVVYNTKTPYKFNLAVQVGYDILQPRKFQVLGVQTESPLAKLADTTSVQPHHKTHEWMVGQDVVFSDLRQLMPLRVTPAGNFIVNIGRNVSWLNGQWQLVSGTYMDLSALVPPTGARYSLLYVDDDTSIQAITGTVKDLHTCGLADIPHPIQGTIPLAGVRTYNGQVAIQELYTSTDVVDLRWSAPHFTNTFNITGSSGGCCTGTSGVSDFLGLTDTPDSYIGAGGYGVYVKGDESGLEFRNITGTISPSNRPGFPISTGTMNLWMRADLLSQTDNTGVSSWSDVSTSADTASQGTPANQPIFRNINGSKRVDFNGSHWLDFASSLSFLTVFIVGRFYYVGAFNNIFSNDKLSVYQLNSGYLGLYRNGNLQGPSVYTIGHKMLFSARLNVGVNTTIAYNGLRLTAGLGTDLAVGTMRLGWDGAGGQEGVFSLYEVIGFSSQLSDSDMIAVENYLMQIYGVD